MKFWNSDLPKIVNVFSLIVLPLTWLIYRRCGWPLKSASEWYEKKFGPRINILLYFPMMLFFLIMGDTDNDSKKKG